MINLVIMKKIFVMLILGIVFFNIQLIIGNSFYSIELQNLEVYANCESPVKMNLEIGSYLRCTNDDGTSYSIPCCDFDPGYDEYCHGRNCGNK